MILVKSAFLSLLTFWASIMPTNAGTSLYGRVTEIKVRHSRFKQALAITTVFIAISTVYFLLTASVAHAQMTQGTDVNISKLTGYQNECSIAVNPADKMKLFVACNNDGGGLFAASSSDRGLTWVNQSSSVTLPGLPSACCHPTVAWDIHENLYLGFVDDTSSNIVILFSTDGGASFNSKDNFTVSTGSVDHPTLAASNTTVTGVDEAVWVVWQQDNELKARGAQVTGAGPAGISAFNAIQTIPGTTNCSFGDVAIAPNGAVVQTCQTPTTGEGPASILVNTDADGLGINNFGAAITATTTDVGGIDFIPPQDIAGVNAAAGLAYDRYPGTLALPNPRFGRLYLVYTDETLVSGEFDSEDTEIWLRFSDDDGATWSARIRVDDEDVSTPVSKSQFLPRIASNPKSGNIAVCWYDNRNTATTSMEEYCSIATPTPAVPDFTVIGAIAVSDVSSDNTGAPVGAGVDSPQFGGYSGMAYFQGVVHPVWASTSAVDNPDAGKFDVFTDQITGGTAANEGDPHMTTVDGTRYDFQSAGEFVSLRGDGLEIQTRQTPVATTFFPGANPHTGLATCVSLNTAVAARVGQHRVSYQPDINGVPNPDGLQLRVDGKLITLSASGLDLSEGGRIVKSAVGNGIEITFPSGSTLIATPGWWASQSEWYLNINVYNTLATAGTLGHIASDSWLPALPDGTSLGPRPRGQFERYETLNKTFANAWRVTDRNSLFDYKKGTSTADFTMPSWPLDKPPCVLEEMPQVQPADLVEAQAACVTINDDNSNANCVFDVMVTGETNFAETYIQTQQLKNGSTRTIVNGDRDISRHKETVTFFASVTKTTTRKGARPVGSVQFILNGNNIGEPVSIDSNGRAIWKTSTLAVGEHQVRANYSPASNTVFLGSNSPAENHTVMVAETDGVNDDDETDNWLMWLAILIVVMLILILVIWMFRRP